MKVPLIPLCTAVFCIVGGVHAAVVQVQAGPNNQLVFSPDTVTANVGDTVNFQMVGALHTVAQSPGRLNGPCDTGSGFDSGPTHGEFLNVAPLPAPLVVTPFGAFTDGQIYTVNISSLDAIYVHCQVRYNPRMSSSRPPDYPACVVSRTVPWVWS